MDQKSLREAAIAAHSYSRKARAASRFAPASTMTRTESRRVNDQRWKYLCAIAHFEGAWRDCPGRSCRARRRCCAGQRGTLRRLAALGLIPLPPCRADAPVGWPDAEILGPAEPLGAGPPGG